MPRYTVTTTATATIRETWTVEATSPEAAENIVLRGSDSEPCGQIVGVEDETIGDEVDREIESPTAPTVMSPPVFDHAFTIAFSLRSSHATGEDVTPAMLRAALMQRIIDLDGTMSAQRPEGEWIEATGAPNDTYQVE